MIRLSSSAAALMAVIALAAASPAQPTGVCGTWSTVPTPSPSATFNRFFGAAAASADDIWAVGEADMPASPSNLQQTLTAHWDGLTWSQVPSPNVGPSGSIFTGVAAVSASQVWAVGYSSTFGSPQTLVARWDGSSWGVVPSPVIQGGSSLAAVAVVTGSELWAVGNRSGGLPEFNTTVSTLTVRWTGSSWSLVPSPYIGNRWNDLVDVTVAGPNDVWAVGSWRDTGGLYQNLALHWNGSGWSIVPTPNLSGENELSAVAAVSPSDVWALGANNDGVVSRSISMHWDGTQWSYVDIPGGSAGCMGCDGALVALASDDVWAAGATIVHWDGAQWSLVPNPDLPGSTGMSLAALTRVGPCDVWAVGSAAAVPTQSLAAHLVPGGGQLNQPPVPVAAGEPRSGQAPLTVQFSAAGSHDPDGSIVSYLWNFGDSSTSNSTDPDPAHTYVQTGPLTYHAVLTVTDDGGATSTASVKVTIEDPTSSASASFEGLGDLTGGEFVSYAHGVSADGSVVVGQGFVSDGSEAFRWTPVGELSGLGAPLAAPSHYSEGLAAGGGGVIVGAFAGPNGLEPFRWTPSGGMVGLGVLNPGNQQRSALGVSADGGVIVGRDGSSAFRWSTGGGMEDLGNLGGAPSSAAGVAADGNVVVGQSYGVNGFEAFRWTSADGMIGLGDLPGGEFWSCATAVSADGNVVVGQGSRSPNPLGERTAFRWTPGTGLTELGDLPTGNTETEARAVSADGAVIVGTAASPGGQTAWLWTAALGMVELKPLLQQLGVPGLDAWSLRTATGVSADGNTIVGHGITPAGQQQAWIAHLAAAATAAPVASVTTLSLHVAPPGNDGTVMVSYALAGLQTDMRLAVYDVRGRLVRELEHDRRDPGQYSYRWEGRDAAGTRLARGVYFVHLVAGGQRETRKVLLTAP